MDPDRSRDTETRWEALYRRLSAADRETPLAAADVERLAMAAYLTGREGETADLWIRAYTNYLERGDARRAARCVFWIGLAFASRGERAQASGWSARGRRLLDDEGIESAERGYLLVPIAREHAARRDFAVAARTFEEASRIGAAFGDADLANLARHGQGRALIAMGQTAEGVALLDEVMVAVTSGELSPAIAGIIYCSVISACFDMLDIRRAQEWTDALNRWCASQPDVVPYRGQCLVHRAEILVLHGLWPDAMTEAQRACERLTEPEPQAVAGAAYYQLAELHRLRGQFTEAERSYRLVVEAGRTPQPGLALMRLQLGQLDAARAAIVHAREAAGDRRTRAGVLAAAVEIHLASGDTEAAGVAAGELATLATTLDTPFARALSLHASGAILLTQGHAHDALLSLRDARTLWRELNVPYESARASALIADACRALGDRDGADMERLAARRTFEQLGATPALHALDSAPRTPANGGEPLTGREMEVLKLVACGKTNRTIADELGISEKTVARHVSNIFVKLDVSSRAGATAYAFTRRLV